MNDRQDCCGNWERPSERWQERVCDAVMGNGRPDAMGLPDLPDLPDLPVLRVRADREEKGDRWGQWGREAFWVLRDRRASRDPSVLPARPAPQVKQAQSAQPARPAPQVKRVQSAQSARPV